MKNICPLCNKRYFEPPAISRRNGKDICPECGMAEALQDAGWTSAEIAETQEFVRDMTEKCKGMIS